MHFDDDTRYKFDSVCAVRMRGIMVEMKSHSEKCLNHKFGAFWTGQAATTGMKSCSFVDPLIDHNMRLGVSKLQAFEVNNSRYMVSFTSPSQCDHLDAQHVVGSIWICAICNIN